MGLMIRMMIIWYMELWDVYEMLNDSISVDEINEGLDALYDAADTYRIWIK
jgi:hypothetical protein